MFDYEVDEGSHILDVSKSLLFIIRLSQTYWFLCEQLGVNHEQKKLSEISIEPGEKIHHNNYIKPLYRKN